MDENNIIATSDQTSSSLPSKNEKFIDSVFILSASKTLAEALGITGFKKIDFPIATEWSESVVTLPLYPGLTNKQLDYIIDVIYHIWEKYQL